MRYSRHAFTLIELLVVISIISVLVALLLPALQKSRQTALAMDCMSRMRAFAVYEENYRTDHKMWYTVNYTLYATYPRYPGPYYRGSFETLIFPYIPAFTWNDAAIYNAPRAHRPKLNPYICPTNVTPNDYLAATVRLQGYIEGVYGNYRISAYYGYGDGQETTLWTYRRPKREVLGATSLMVMFGEWRGASVAFGDSNNTSGIIYRHSDASNLIFADGHGKGYTNIANDVATGVYRLRLQ
jgi:prepilin-type N-terminal cleavage/methylation domain-containing protein/prepilin-type processing-associated H-X9-DG protein